MSEVDELLEEFLTSRVWPRLRQAVNERIQLHAEMLVTSNPESGEEAWALLKSGQAVIGELTQLVNSPRSYFKLTEPGS